MISFTEFFEAITFFGEIVIGQIGFQVIAISLGRRGLGEWNPQDSIRFVVMLSTSIIATLICYAPFYAVTIFKLELLELINLLIVLSMIFVTLFSFYLISIFKKVINFSDFVGSMDGKDDGKIKDGTSFYSASYKGQKDGQKVKKSKVKNKKMGTDIFLRTRDTIRNRFLRSLR